MNFKLVSKNNMGAVIALILVVLLSQSKFFYFCFESYLGRMLLLILIIFVAYTNKILGLFVVLCIIVAFNINSMNVVQSYNYYEGFDGSGNLNIVPIDKSKEDILKGKLNVLQKNASDSSQTTTTTTTSSAVSSESFRGREGFNLQDMEGSMLRGKPSNAVPVFNDSRLQNDNVSPSDKHVFSSGYSSF